MMYSQEGLLQILKELQDIVHLFEVLDNNLTALVKPTMEKIGITDELLGQATLQVIEGNDGYPLMSQRRLKKSEYIVKVWNVKIPDGAITQVFETEDGCLWQLCDVGLGWTKLNKSSLDWKINDTIQNYLPANINPRPSITDAWNYRFALAGGVSLVISRGRQDRTYKIRIDRKGS